LEDFLPIINQPESAILGVGAIMEKPVVVDKEIVIRPMMKITLAYDHRVIDGAKAGQFMMTLKEFIENPFSRLA
jgi:pyruvate dehydrogenase E2 component (dihydrolipoamide acetyltransferase)